MKTVKIEWVAGMFDELAAATIAFSGGWVVFNGVDGEEDKTTYIPRDQILRLDVTE